MKLFYLLLSFLLLSGCATIVSGKSEMVTFVNAPESGATVQTPTGNHKLRGSSGTFMLLKSRPNVPIQVTCNNKRQHGVLQTGANTAFILGNFVSWGIIGWLIDGFGSSGYNYQQPVNLSYYCTQENFKAKQNDFLDDEDDLSLERSLSNVNTNALVSIYKIKQNRAILKFVNNEEAFGFSKGSVLDIKVKGKSLTMQAKVLKIKGKKILVHFLSESLPKLSKMDRLLIEAK